MILDDAGNLTKQDVLSSAGIYVVDVEELCANEETYYSLYNAQSGLSSGITANSWNYISEDGVLYFCCNDGVVQFSGDSWMKNVNYCYGISEVKLHYMSPFLHCTCESVVFRFCLL